MTKKYKCRVEYLESTGTQYIDTGVIGNGEFNVKYGLYANSIGSSSDIFAGARSSTQHLNFGQAASNGQFTLGYLNQYWQELSNFAINTRYDIEISYKSGEQYAIINGTKGSSKTYTGTEQTDLTIYLFKRHHYGTDNVGGLQGRIYYFTIKQNNVLVRDFIPVLDNSGRPAMYDQVSGQLFYNQGSGEFSYGRQIIPVEYLESTGTQYIDTGIKGKNNLHYKTKVNFTTLSTGSSNGIGGEYLGNASAYIGMVRANGHFTYLFNNTAVETTKTFYANTDYVIDSTMNNGSQIVKVNNETISTGTLSGTFTSTRNIFLYAICSTNEAADVYGSLKMYYCQIYDNDTLVRDFIPCIDENLTPFMFDKVNGTVYLNAGTGQFKVGPNVEKAWGGKKLRKKLALMLANLKKKRKYYCEVEWIKTDAINSYFNTGINGDNNNLKFDIYFSTTTTDLYAPIFGNADQEAQNNWGIIKGNNSSLGYANTRRNSGLNFTEYKTDGTLNHIIFYRQGNSCIMNVNGTTTSQNLVAGTSNNANIYIGRAGPTRSPTSSRECKHYRFMIYDNDVLVRDFIPVLDWNMTPCMYDRVTEQLFYNQGTGNFVAGREIHYVDYLESTGVEYIDTGIKFDGANTKIEVKTHEDSLTRRHSICGDDGNFFYYFRGTGNWAVGYNGTAANIDSYMSVGDVIFVIDKNNVYVNDVLATTYTASSSVSAYNALLFNRKTSLVDNGAVTMYYCKMWNNNVLVRDYIPAISEDGTPFMFDRVSHTCFLNQGTGAFKYPAREVEYLQSDGARAIVAGVTVDDTSGYDVKWMALNANDTIILGTKGSGDSRWALSGNNNPNVNLSWNTLYVGVGLGLNKIQTAQMNYFNDRKRILNDTPLTDITQTLSANASTYSVVIFGGYWGASSISLYSTCRIYYAKITKGSDVIRDYIAAFKDGSPCLFDKVEQLAYFGTGTGTFTTGKIVEPEYE